MQAVTLGFDPEVWVVQQGAIVPSCGLIGGGKKNALPVKGSKWGLAVLEDNVTLEINASPIQYTPDLDIQEILVGITSELRAFLRDKDLAFTYGSSYNFTDEQLASEQAQVMGCDPDFLAYQHGASRAALSPEIIGNWRFTAGHVHIGYDVAQSGIPPQYMVMMVEALTYLRWLPTDLQNQRRRYYGIAGLFRPTAYGVEWRTPSHFWMSYGAFLNDVGAVAQAVIKDVAKTQRVYAFLDKALATNVGGKNLSGWEVVQDIINAERTRAIPYDALNKAAKMLGAEQ